MSSAAVTPPIAGGSDGPEYSNLEVVLLRFGTLHSMEAVAERPGMDSQRVPNRGNATRTIYFVGRWLFAGSEYYR